MGTKGQKNTPITARVNAGLFNQKKGITEPLLNVGPAGVYGDNQTRDIPSPSKIKGYSMKASPFKQAKVKADEGDIKVITPGENTTKKVTVPGTPGTENLDQAIIDNGTTILDRPATAEETRIANKRIADAKAKDIEGAEPTEKEVVVKGKPRERPVQIRDAEDTQTARERSNTVRGGKRMNKKERQAQKKIDRLNRKSGAIDPSTIKKDKVTGKDIEGSGTKYDRKKQKNARLMKEAEDNKKLASASSEGAQRQAEQNRSISARKTGTLKSNERDLRESDATSDTTKKLVDKQLGVDTTTQTKPNPTDVSGVSQDEIKGQAKKTSGFFKTKSPMKKNYFK